MTTTLIHFFSGLTISTALPYVLSILTLIHAHMVGELHPKTWVFGIFCQCIWLVYIIHDERWGFLILTVALTYKFFKNHQKWKTVGIIKERINGNPDHR